MFTTTVLSVVLASTESPTAAPTAAPTTTAPTPAGSAELCADDSCASCDPLTETCIFFDFDRVSRPEDTTCAAGTAARYASKDDDTITDCTPCSESQYFYDWGKTSLCTSCSEKYTFPGDDRQRVMTCDSCAEHYELVVSELSKPEVSWKTVVDGVWLHHTEYWKECKIQTCYQEGSGGVTRKIPNSCDCCASEDAKDPWTGMLECCDEGECADVTCESDETAPAHKTSAVTIALILVAVAAVMALAGFWCCSRARKRTAASSCLATPLVDDEAPNRIV